ncbi:lysozyme [Candidatus Liberibacter sp.]|uniref:lysozyme n=1 Tax=Candidatus Liberibacter sp. TaxID=34022 RepID=UPI002174FB03|nr:glycoside hydrolase family protein [Candidatus Liberibacter sp.]
MPFSGENRISAIGDFVFNLGIGAYRNSTLRKRVDAQDWENASIEIRKWVFAGGKRLNGLVVRREVEAGLLLNG